MVVCEIVVFRWIIFSLVEFLWSFFRLNLDWVIGFFWLGVCRGGVVFVFLFNF